MTTIGSTSYYPSATRYSGADRSNADRAYTGSSETQEIEAKNGRATSTVSDSSETPFDSRPSTATINLQGKLFTSARLATDLEPINISELPEADYKAFMEGEEQRLAANKFYLENQYTQYSEPDYSNDPRMESYATITVAGKVVAKIDNQGVVGTTDDALSKRLRNILLGDVNGTNGPDLAQARAEQIANFLGGRIVEAPTAINQRQFNALPPFEQPEATVDYEGMKNDPLYQQLQNMSANFEKIQQQRVDFLARTEAGTAH
jgi:hypothetical protein